MTNYQIHKAGHQLDILGRPIKVGDTVLVTGYCSTTLDQKATVLAVNKKSISVDVEYTDRFWGSYDPITRSYPDTKFTTKLKRMQRQGYRQVLVIPSDLVDSAAQAKQEFIDTHPEIFV